MLVTGVAAAAVVVAAAGCSVVVGDTYAEVADAGAAAAAVGVDEEVLVPV